VLEHCRCGRRKPGSCSVGQSFMGGTGCKKSRRRRIRGARRQMSAVGTLQYDVQTAGNDGFPVEVRG